MAECNGFTLSRRGYNCGEVDDYVAQAQRADADLRESYAALQQRYDILCGDNERLLKEKDRIANDCTTLALALKQLREGNDANGTSYKEKYEQALAELESMKAIVIDDGYRIKYEEALTQIEQLKAENAAVPPQPEQVVDCGEAASKMVTEVAEVVQKLEKDARRKAEAITLSAKLEQAQAQLIKSRVSQEVRSLIDMLECYLRDHPEEPQTHAE